MTPFVLQAIEPPVLVHACMKEILINGSQLVFQLTIEELNDVFITFHADLPKLWPLPDGWVDAELF